MSPLQSTILFWVQLVFFGVGAGAMLYLPVSTWRREQELKARTKAMDADLEAMRGRLETDFKEHLAQRWTCPECGARLEPCEMPAIKPVAHA